MTTDKSNAALRLVSPTLGTDQRQIVATPFTYKDPATIPPRPWLYGHHYMRGIVSVDVAPGGAGKTSLKIAEAVAMATNRNLLGKNMGDQPLNVWLYNLEDSADELDRRIAAVCQHYGIGADDFGGRLFCNSGLDQPCVIATTTPGGTQIVQPVFDSMLTQVRRRGIDVVIIDPFVSSHGVSENDNSAIDMVVKQGWARIAVLGNCAVNLVHQVRKAGSDEVTADSARGASALVNAARSVRVYNVMSRREAGLSGVEERRAYMKTSSDKANHAKTSDKGDWHKLISVTLPNGDSVGVVTPWAMAEIVDDGADEQLPAIKRRVAADDYRLDPQADQWVGHIVGAILQLDTTKPCNKSAIAVLIDRWISEGHLTVEESKDKSYKLRKFVRVGRPTVPELEALPAITSGKANPAGAEI